MRLLRPPARITPATRSAEPTAGVLSHELTRRTGAAATERVRETGAEHRSGGVRQSSRMRVLHHAAQRVLTARARAPYKARRRMAEHRTRGPLPKPTPETRPFWDAAKQHRLLIQALRRLRHALLLSAPALPACLSRRVRWIDASGRGRLHTFVINHRPPRGFPVPAPFVIGIVELEEGPRMMSHIVDVDARPGGAALRPAARGGVRGPHRRDHGAEVPAAGGGMSADPATPARRRRHRRRRRIGRDRQAAGQVVPAAAHGGDAQRARRRRAVEARRRRRVHLRAATWRTTCPSTSASGRASSAARRSAAARSSCTSSTPWRRSTPACARWR